MHYKEMLEEAKAKGLTSEAKMWESIEEVEELLEEVKKENPKMFWKFLRKQHGLLHDNHYDELFAKWDVENMQPLGEYWSMKQVEEATKGMAFPDKVTLCDKFVALNAFANDLHDVIPDDMIIKAAHAFWFADKDWGGKGKIWEYMKLANKLRK
jgi:predicted Zn-dependent protease with MMP-like domain